MPSEAESLELTAAERDALEAAAEGDDRGAAVVRAFLKAEEAVRDAS